MASAICDYGNCDYGKVSPYCDHGILVFLKLSYLNARVFVIIQKEKDDRSMCLINLKRLKPRILRIMYTLSNL